MRKLIELCLLAVEKNASDILLINDKPPQIKVHGVFQPVRNEPVIDKNKMTEFTKELVKSTELPEGFIKTVKKKGVVEIALTLETKPILTRLRISIYLEKGNLAISIRLLPQRIFSFEEIFLLQDYIPKIKNLLMRWNGLILVTGPTGTGKTTTLATFLDYILKNRSVHFITLEDPIEFVFDNRAYLGTVSQREYGRDFFDFASAIVSGMRQAPNGFVVAEIRDLQTAETALRAAETGHLVIATLHTRNAAETVTRYVDIFPEIIRPLIRTQFSMATIGILCQRLIPHASGSGRVACFELVFVKPAYANLIREWKIQQLDAYVRGEIGIRYDEYLVELIKRGIVTPNDGFSYANDPSELKRLLDKEK